MTVLFSELYVVLMAELRQCASGLRTVCDLHLGTCLMVKVCWLNLCYTDIATMSMWFAQVVCLRIGNLPRCEMLLHELSWRLIGNLPKVENLLG